MSQGCKRLALKGGGAEPDVSDWKKRRKKNMCGGKGKGNWNEFNHIRGKMPLKCIYYILNAKSNISFAKIRCFHFLAYYVNFKINFQRAKIRQFN